MQADLLAKSQLFADLDEQSLKQIASVATSKPVGKNNLVFYEGDVALSFYIVVTGRVKIFKTSPDGKEQILMIAAPGDSFAEAAMFSGGKFPASAQALENSRLIVFSRDLFVKLLAEQPSLALSLIGRLSELLRQMTKLVESLSLTNVTTRLASFIRDQAQSSEAEKNSIHLVIKKSVLASQLGTIPETLSRSFAKLVRDNIIKVDGPTITVLDPDRLEKVCGEK